MNDSNVKRSIAITWWQTLSDRIKMKLANEYIEIRGRTITSLTGREVEWIYNKYNPQD